MINRHTSVATALLFALCFSLLPSQAQPGWVKKASKAVFTLKTFDKDGQLLASTTGFCTSQDGEAISSFSPFKGAARAVAIDAQGKEYEVVSIIGANDMYDVARFRIDARKMPSLTVSTAVAPEGSTVWLLPYRELKAIPGGTVSKAETFLQQYAYYTVAMALPEHGEGCPLLNDAGEVIGLMQPSASEGDKLSYAVSALFADSLKATGIGMFDPTLSMTLLKKELPDNLQEANVAVYLAASRADSAQYAAIIDDFIQKFPEAADGYIYRARQAAQAGRFADADEAMQQAIRRSDTPADTRFVYARMIYQKEIYQSDKPFAAWSLDKALSEIRQATTSDPQPSYRQLEGDILFAQHQYGEACDVYTRLSATAQNKAELLFSAARCKEMLNDTTAWLALLDSTMACYPKPYLKEAAPYLWTRAEARQQAGRYREAVSDMNDYEELMRASVNDNFYYLRHKAEIEARLYQQALNDIEQAIRINPQETLYYAEKASLEIRVGLFDQAIETARELSSVDDSDSDGYLFLGLAQCLKGQKSEGIANLTKAKELGNPQAEPLIRKYQ